MGYLRIWPTVILSVCITVALALKTSVRSSHLGYDGRYNAPRQASIFTRVITTTTDHSSVAAPTPASRPSVASDAIVIPFLPSTITTPPSSTFLSTSALSSISSTHNIITSAPTYSPSSIASPTPSAQVTSTFKFVYLIPAIALVGVLLGGLIGWVIYGCMTRKPRMRRDDETLLVGPRYIGIDEPERINRIQDHDIERGREHTQMKNLPGTIRASPHFRWPSFNENEKPTFHPVQGFHVPDEYMHDDDPLLALPLATRSNTNANAKATSKRRTRPSKSVHTFKSTRDTTAGLSRDILASPASHTTSLALLELYESDEEEETRRKQHEVPWESLRHKSIKRGIIEQVKKEGKWMDSIRGLAGSNLLGSHTGAESNALLGGGPDLDNSMEAESYVGRRRGYSVPDSDPFADSPTRTRSISPKKRPTAKSRDTDSTTASIGFRIIPESAVTTPNHSPRRGFAWLKKDDAEISTPPSTPIAEGRKHSQRQKSQSTSPVKRTSDNNGVPSSEVPRRDILPQSPAQIMSPPLQSQISFTPIPASSAPQSSRDYHPKSRVSVSLSPTRPLMISNTSKSKRKIQPLHRLSKPPLSLVPDVRNEVSRGRVPHKPGFSGQVVKGRSGGDRVNIAAGGESSMLEDPMKKVEQIMASSWSVRDLGQGGMRSLSPTGFGRRL